MVGNSLCSHLTFSIEKGVCSKTETVKNWVDGERLSNSENWKTERKRDGKRMIPVYSYNMTLNIYLLCTYWDNFARSSENGSVVVFLTFRFLRNTKIAGASEIDGVDSRSFCSPDAITCTLHSYGWVLADEISASRVHRPSVVLDWQRFLHRVGVHWRVQRFTFVSVGKEDFAEYINCTGNVLHIKYFTWQITRTNDPSLRRMLKFKHFPGSCTEAKRRSFHLLNRRAAKWEHFTWETIRISVERTISIFIILD